MVKDHVLLPWAAELDKVDEAFRKILTPETIDQILSLIPGEWLASVVSKSVEENRDVYRQFLLNRLSFTFIKEAQHARQAFI